MEHSYNSSGVCPCLDFRPIPETSKLLTNLGLLCKKTADGIVLVYDLERREALELLAQTEPTSFDFKAYATDPDFKSYSEPFSGDNDDILYFDNRAADGSGKQDLAASGTVSERDFIADGASELEGILTPQDRLLPPVFVLRMFSGDSGELLSEWLDAASKAYTIRFVSRQRYWKYYLLGKITGANGSGDRFNIVDPDNQIEFEATGEETLSDRRVAYTFRSNQQIPLHEYYSYRFQLQQQGQNGETVVIPCMPYASVKQVGMDTVAQQHTIVSEIYINS